MILNFFLIKLVPGQDPVTLRPVKLSLEAFAKFRPDGVSSPTSDPSLKLEPKPVRSSSSHSYSVETRTKQTLARSDRKKFLLVEISKKEV